jgi:hypothetical protein
LLTDDLDGGEAETTVSFAFDGMAYDIDLSGENAAKFREVMGPYLAAGTRKGRAHVALQGAAAHTRAEPGARTDRQTLVQIRDWAKRNGYQLAVRGRIPTHVTNAYYENRPNPNLNMTEDALPGMPEAIKATPAQIEQAAPPAKKVAAKATARRGPAKLSRTN